jgi:hypothetical protein
MRPSLPSLLALAFLTSPTLALDTDDLILNEYMYCIKYYGSLSADIQLPESAIPAYNYNGTIRCPTSFRTPYVSGATVMICPPDSGLEENNLALEVTLSYRSSGGQLDGPIDVVDFAPGFVTNGSVDPGLFEEDGVRGVPAVLARDMHRGSDTFPVWTINGTEKSLIEAPEEGDDDYRFYVSCAYEGSYVYCGGYEDNHVEGAGGCWRDQFIYLNMKTPLNYTFRFDNNEASVELWVESPYTTYMGNETGGYTSVYLRFEGDRHLPSIVDYDFWRGSESVYEVEEEFLAERSAMMVQGDEGGLVLLVNETGYGGGGEWYDSANGTFSSQKINGAGGRGDVVGVGRVMLVLGMGMGVWVGSGLW